MGLLTDVLRWFPAMSEFGYFARAIAPVMVSQSISVKDKRKTLNASINNLKEKSFSNRFVAIQIIIIINMKEEECKKFIDTEEQVDSILKWLPRMELHRDRLTNKVKSNRRKCRMAE